MPAVEVRCLVLPLESLYDALPARNQRAELHYLVPGRAECQFLQPGMLPSGSQLSGVFLAIRVMVRVTGLPVLA